MTRRLCLAGSVNFRDVSVWLAELGFPSPRVRTRVFPARPEPSEARWESAGTSVTFEYVPSPDRRLLSLAGEESERLALSAEHRLGTISVDELEASLFHGAPGPAFVAVFRLAGLERDAAIPTLFRALGAPLESHVHNGCVRALGEQRGSEELARRLERLASPEEGLALETRALATEAARAMRSRIGRW